MRTSTLILALMLLAIPVYGQSSQPIGVIETCDIATEFADRVDNVIRKLVLRPDAKHFPPGSETRYRWSVTNTTCWDTDSIGVHFSAKKKRTTPVDKIIHTSHILIRHSDDEDAIRRKLGRHLLKMLTAIQDDINAS